MLDLVFALPHESRAPPVIDVVHVEVSMDHRVQFDLTGFQEAGNLLQPLRV